MAAPRLLAGFANPALLTVLALLIIGQGMVRTGILDRGAEIVLGLGGRRAWLTILITLVVVLGVSGFLNNIPVVVIFIPIMEAVAGRYGMSSSKVMMPLSFAAVLGGMTTLIGSGTNLLVSGALVELGEKELGFFQFTVPGLVLAGAGLLFVFLIAPHLIPARAPFTREILDGDGKQFIAQITLAEDSDLVGLASSGGLFGAYPEMTLRMIQRGREVILPPFEDITLSPGDILVVAATRMALTEALAKDPGLLIPDLGVGRDGVPGRWEEDKRMLAEVLVRPASRLAGVRVGRTGFHRDTDCNIVAVQRRTRMLRTQLDAIRLQEGDMLLVQGRPTDIRHLRRNTDVVLLEWSAAELPALDHAKRASLIFLGVISLAATGTVPVVVAALLGVAALVGTGTLPVAAAVRALDSRIFTMIPAALAMGLAMEVTGGAAFLSGKMVALLAGAAPAVVLSAFFLLVALLSNVVSAKAAAVLFTPIAVGIARQLGVPVEPFAIAVVFAANCAIATPIGYQTSLLVMGPGHYAFADYLRAGSPLIILLWVVFSLFAPWYYGL
jgi:di/tricarboxylate transporter